MVDYRIDGKFAILVINNPPVNALSYHVRVGLAEAIEKAAANDRVQAVILTGKGAFFSSGADIKEFDKPSKAPWITVVGRQIEDCPKPVVSAIPGVAFGGGLEIALFTHYRIATKNARVAFPEVNIGILPGAEGTVRLPRLAGVAAAMDIISSGRQIGAAEALKYGILDKVVTGDLLQEAKQFASTVIGKPLDSRRLINAPVKDAASVDKIYDDALVEVKRKYKGMTAPVNCLKSVRSAAKLPFEAAVKMERDLFQELMTGAQSKALRYAFFADRLAPKWALPGGANVTNTKPQDVKSAGVIGAGTMGAGIAVCLIRVGIPVLLVEQSDKFLQQGLKNINQILEGSVRLKRMTLQQKNQCLRILKGVSSLDALSDVDLVIEAVYENLQLKREIFAKLDKICKPSAVLCTNTSTLDIDKISSATSRPEKVVGAHFFAPSFIMKLLENVYGSKTSPSTVATVMDLGKRIGKISVLVRTCHGFVANRMNYIGSEARFIVEEGALPQDVDRVLEDFGMLMGTFKVNDLSGIDVGHSINKERAKSFGVELTLETRFVNGERYCSLGERLYQLGRYGRKTGKGWYRYEAPNTRTAFPDPDVTDLIEKHCKSLGIKRRAISPQEILERCLYSSINEGFKLLEQGVAHRPEDIDVIWQYGFSFPRYRGGPMFYASQVGLKKLYERICYYHETFPYSSYWVPSDLLRRLASHDKEIPLNRWADFAHSKL